MKSISSIVGAFFCHNLAEVTGSLVNPIEKGYPDIVPSSASDASDASLMHYPSGIEVKCTIGNLKSRLKLPMGSRRVQDLSSITWQAHHREVRLLMGLVVDWCEDASLNPLISGVFFSDCLVHDDWGSISGTSGRNTKVSGMKKSGKLKMGQDWILFLDEPIYERSYQKLLGVNL